MNATLKKAIRQFAVYISLVVLALFYGVYAHQQHYGIAVIIEDALESQITLFKKPWYFINAQGKLAISTLEKQKMQPGLTKLVRFSSEKTLAVSVITPRNEIIHEWNLDWFDLWPDATHLSWFMKPKSRPGTMIHGAQILDDGSLVFNFEYLGMVRVDACGKVLWRLPVQTHHSIFIDDQGFIWAPANKVRKGNSLKQPLHEPYYVEPFIEKISPDGKVIEEKSVFTLLHDNGLDGILYLTSIDNEKPEVRGDTLHLNDVDVFSQSMKPGFFQPGDIMISLRNANTILVFDPSNWKVKYRVSNLFIRQHDPDFLDGNTISVFDNNNRFSDHDSKAYSRVISIHVPDNTVKVLFSGSDTFPFFSRILGKQQMLENGNLLMTEGRGGRAIEVTPDGEVVWEYNNIVKPDTLAVIQGVERLPIYMDDKFFSDKVHQCNRGVK